MSLSPTASPTTTTSNPRWLASLAVVLTHTCAMYPTSTTTFFPVPFTKSPSPVSANAPGCCFEINTSLMLLFFFCVMVSVEEGGWLRIKVGFRRSVGERKANGRDVAVYKYFFGDAVY